MKRKSPFLLRLVLATVCFSAIAPAQALKPVQLPPPQTTGGRPLMEVLKDRKSTREFGSDTLSPQTLSNLLWAAFGINRPDGRRTAPSAMNWQEISIYVATPAGVYLYDAKANVLESVLAGDFRAATGTQSLPGPCRNSPRQRCSRLGLTSIARATSAMEIPCSSRWIAAILNSRVNRLRDNPMTHFLHSMDFVS
jgi:hypothetical protein